MVKIHNRKKNLWRYTFLVVILLLPLILSGCWDAKKEELYKTLNDVGKETSDFIRNFNKLKYENRDSVNIEESFKRLDGKYKQLYTLILNNKKTIDKNEYRYFIESYISSYENIRTTIVKHLKDNDTDISQKTFTNTYNKIGESLNLFTNTHNNFIKLLENK